MSHPDALVLGIETSCDETGVALVRVTEDGPELLVDAVASSMDEAIPTRALH